MEGIFSAITDFFSLIGNFISLIFNAITIPFRIFADGIAFCLKFVFSGSTWIPWGIGIFIILSVIVGIIAKILGRNF